MEGPSDNSLNLASLDSTMSFNADSFSFTETSLLLLLRYILHASLFASSIPSMVAYSNKINQILLNHKQIVDIFLLLL
jgi:hypothetical protein